MLKKAIILLSGGLDSTTVLALAASQGYECYCLSFDYGQKHKQELEAAKNIADFYAVSEHQIVSLDLKCFASSALTNTLLEVPKHKNLDHLNTGNVPMTYVPARNTIFISYAFGYAESADICNIFIGCNALDYSNYPDCRPEYIAKYEILLNTAKARVTSNIKIHAPLLHLKKSDIIMLGRELEVDYSLTVSCYSPNHEGHACGSCDACLLRKLGFKEAGLVDPLKYSL